MLKNFDTRFQENRQMIAAAMDSVVSTTVYGYPLDKRLLLDYEESLSSILGYTAAQDSIAKQAAAFEKLNYNLRKIEPKERIFIEYGNIERSSPAKYNASNPIPEMELYKQGTVYRIRFRLIPPEATGIVIQRRVTVVLRKERRGAVCLLCRSI